MSLQKLQMAKLRAPLDVMPNSANDDTRSVQVRFYSGASVPRYSWDRGDFELAFDMKPSAVRMDRMKSGRAPLLNAHSSYALENVIGVIDSAQIKNGEGTAVVRFSPTAAVDDIWANVKAGILRNVSMGAVVHQMKEVTQKGDPVPKFLAIDWEPWEISFVPIGADPDAQALAANAERFACKVTFNADKGVGEEATVLKVKLLADVEELGSAGDIVEIEETDFDEELHSKDTSKATPAKGANKETLALDDKSEDRELADIIEADNKRAARIRELQAHYELDDLWSQRHIRLGSSVKAATADAKKRVAGTAPETDGRLKFGEDYESVAWKSERMAEALFSRGTGKPCPEPAKAFARQSIAECGYNVLHALGMTRGRTLDPLRQPLEVVKMAMTTADFPGILQNVLNKTLMGAYEAAPQTFRTFALKRDFKDYRAHTFLRKGDFPDLSLLGQGAEITMGSMGESKESVTALKYAVILPITEEILINDDLGAFNEFGQIVADRIADKESALFYTVITTGSGLGPTLSNDSVVLYNSAHGNVGSAGVISNTLLAEAFGKMTSQTGINGVKIRVLPKYVLTSPTSFITAKTLLTQIQATQASNVNPFAGILEPIYDPNLSSVRFYVLSDPGAGSNYVYGTVGGRGPRFDIQPGWKIDGIEVRLIHTFGAGAIDYRFGYSAAGA